MRRNKTLIHVVVEGIWSCFDDIVLKIQLRTMSKLLRIIDWIIHSSCLIDHNDYLVGVGSFAIDIEWFYGLIN